MYEISVVNTSPFNLTMLRKTNVWYTVKDGNWSDTSIWISNGKRKNLTPHPGDNVYILHTVSIDLPTVITINNLTVQGKLTATNVPPSLTVNGDLQVNGTLDFTGSTINLVLNGYNNYITNFTGGTSTVTYNGSYSQAVMPITYNNLSIAGNYAKYLAANTTVAGTFISNSATSGYLECGIYNFTVNGTSSLSGNSLLKFSKTGSGVLVFKGKFIQGTGFISLTGNPNIEFQGGFQYVNYTLGGFNWGTGAISFTTNNQSIYNSFWTLQSNATIKGAITVTFDNTAFGGTSNFQLNGFNINGDNSLSTLTSNTADTTIWTPDYTVLPMSTLGVFNVSTFSLNFQQSTAFTLPFTSFGGDLILSGIGIKTLAGDTTIGRNFNVGAQSLSTQHLECGNYNLTINGTTNLSVALGPIIKINKTGAGTILFGGFVLFGNGDMNLPGNPTIEMRGGCQYLNNTAGGNWGTTGIKFTTNNQNLIFAGTVNCPMLISGAITVTYASVNSGTFTVNNTINGDNASSVFISNDSLTYKNATAPMATGKLYCNQATNTWIYGLAGNQDITVPSDPASPGYKNLTLNGSGAKKLLGNVSVKGTYTLTSPATLNSNGFALTNP